jgi:hypothetical protein
LLAQAAYDDRLFPGSELDSQQQFPGALVSSRIAGFSGEGFVNRKGSPT